MRIRVRWRFEVAMKMAVQFWRSTGREDKTRFVALRGAYHGDTLGAMSLCDPVTGMHTLFSGVVPGQIFVERPPCRFDAPYDPASFASMAGHASPPCRLVGAVGGEPVVQARGACGFIFPVTCGTCAGCVTSLILCLLPMRLPQALAGPVVCLPASGPA